MAALTLQWRHRPGATGKHERHHIDFIVDGVSLFDLVGAGERDLVGLLGWRPHEEESPLLHELLLRAQAVLPAGRQMLFVCSECGDIGCGAITAQILEQGGRIVWREFAYENDYDPEMTDRVSFAQVGPFEFEAAQYRAALQHA